MGNTCFVPRRRDPPAKLMGLELHSGDEDLGHSFCYVRPTFDSCSEHSLHSSNSNSNSSSLLIDSNNTSEELLGSEPGEPKPPKPPKLAAAAATATTTINSSTSNLLETSFKSISGASVSANTSTSRSIISSEQFTSLSGVPVDRTAAFESTPSFTALPLQKVPRSGGGVAHSGPMVISGGGAGGGQASGMFSGPLERGFLSGPLERGFLSGPLEREKTFCMSGPMERQLSGPLDSTSRGAQRKSLGEFVRNASLPVRRALSRTVSSIARSGRSPFRRGNRAGHELPESCLVSSELLDTLPPDAAAHSGNLQWAQGKAGEDRVHIVLSEEQGWMFVGIYDGFNGPDAPDFLMSNLYPAVYRELQKLLCDQRSELPRSPGGKHSPANGQQHHHLQDMEVDGGFCFDSAGIDHEGFNHRRNGSGGGGGSGCSSRDVKLKSILGVKLSRRKKVSYRKLFRWRYDWEDERSDGSSEEVDGPPIRSKRGGSVDHFGVLRALERALESTERAYLEMTERSVVDNPELALVGSCLLVMLMKDEDVYIMNVGDSRAVLAQDSRVPEPSRSNNSRVAAVAAAAAQVSGESGHQERIGARDSMLRLELERIIEETPTELAAMDSSYDVGDLAPPPLSPTLGALQLSCDHSTSIEKEVLRIRMEHPDDEASIANDRVKGRLKVTRAFGAGYLKQPKLNEAVLEMFRIDFVGEAPYITCTPFLQHHRLGPRDQFLVLSSDGLYQYLSNEEVVAHVEWFMEKFPDGDPAQYLIEELLFRAAKKAGMDFHELLDIPQGDRRKYHDDVSVMVISLEGRIWRSSG